MTRFSRIGAALAKVLLTAVALTIIGLIFWGFAIGFPFPY